MNIKRIFGLPNCCYFFCLRATVLGRFGARTFFLVVFLLLLASNHATVCQAVENKKPLPNVVIILVDDMGYGDPACFNSQSKISTPSINSLARDGMIFTDAHAPGPLCHMSRYGLLTGRYPFRTNVSIWPQHPLIEKNQATIASISQAAGYRTAMVGKWHCGFVEEDGYDKPLPGGPVHRGFDTFFGIRASTDIPPYFFIRDDHAVSPPIQNIAANRSKSWSPIQGAFWRGGGISCDLKLHDVLPRFTNEAIGVIKHHAADKSSNRPLMLYLAYPAPHTPWLPAGEFRGKSGAGMYGDFLMMVDSEIGRVLAAIENEGMSEETMIVFTSDNGPVWYEEDTQRFEHDSAGGLRGMKSDAWEAGHRMPFIVRWPGEVSPGTASAHLVCFTDLLATFAQLMQLDLLDGVGPDSFSFLPELTGVAERLTPERKQFVMRAGSVASMMVIRSGQWKLITERGSGGFSPPSRLRPSVGKPAGQLYRMPSDRSEFENLYSSHPEIVAKLERELQQVVSASSSRLLGD